MLAAPKLNPSLTFNDASDLVIEYRLQNGARLYANTTEIEIGSAFLCFA